MEVVSGSGDADEDHPLDPPPPYSSVHPLTNEIVCGSVDCSWVGEGSAADFEGERVAWLVEEEVQRYHTENRGK